MRSFCLNLLGRPLGLAVLLLLTARATVAPGPRPPRPGKVLWADISFLPRPEARGVEFADRSGPKDAIQILKAHDFNYIRLRIFNTATADSGYSPGKGFCDFSHTLARRVHQAGLRLLLDFHDSDTWADPQKQLRPLAWKNLHGLALEATVHNYTKDLLGVLVMLHTAPGGQNRHFTLWLNRMVASGVAFDVIGKSYYPKWHGIIPDLKTNLADLAKRYPQGIVVAEYFERKREVNNVAFNLPGGKSKGTFIWEPLKYLGSRVRRAGLV